MQGKQLCRQITSGNKVGLAQALGYARSIFRMIGHSVKFAVLRLHRVIAVLAHCFIEDPLYSIPTGP